MADFEETIDETVQGLTISDDADLGQSPVGIAIPDLTIVDDTKLGQSPIPITVPDLTIVSSQAIAIEQAVIGAAQREIGVGDVDFTDEANDAVADDVPLLPDPKSDGDGFLVGANVKFNWILFNMSMAGVGSCTITWQYWDGSAWQSLNVIYDSTSDFKVTGLSRVHIVKPSDWIKRSVISKTLYWLFGEASSGTMTTQPVATQLWVGNYAPSLGGQMLSLALT